MFPPSRPSAPVVFVGPALSGVPPEEQRRLLDGYDVRPPARRGDVLSVLSKDPHTLVILDGYYYTVPSVTHKEILYALNAGVRVIGAASMGALRAAELERYGMIGAGRVFRWYADGVIEGDDEVAVLHDSRDEGYRTVTLALVEVRRALEDLLGRGEVSAQEAGTLLDDLRRTSFAERHPERVLERCSELLGDAARDALDRELGAKSLKEEDARRALELARQPFETRGPGDLLPTAFLNADREWHICLPSRPVPSRPVASRPVPAGPVLAGLRLMRTWNAVQLLHPEAPEFVRRLRLRWVLATAAHDAGLEPEPGRIEEIVAQLRRALRPGQAASALTEPELLEEARMLAGAERACEELGGWQGACATAAERLGLDRRDGAGKLLALVASDPAMVPSWWLCRSFCFSETFPTALRAAASIAEVHRCFLYWTLGAAVTARELAAVASELWQCEPAAVTREAARRGLFESPGPEPGWRDAVEWIAAAERLPRPINDYPEVRRALRSMPLSPFRSSDPGATPLALPAES